jgi:2-keto-3-deoxy-L-fuconate dehydrogenase
MRLAGKTAMVTAAAHGIGAAIANRFRDEGAHVLALDFDLDALSRIEGVEHLVVDLTDREAISDAARAVGAVDILVNVAGYVHAGTILDCDEDDWSLSLQLNVEAMYRLIRGLLPGMLDRGAGAIVNVSSIASSIKGIPNRFAYGTTKAAVIGLTKSVAADYVGHGIRCNAICPGTVETPSLHRRMTMQAEEQQLSLAEVQAAFVARQPMGRLGRPEEIAALALYLASDEAAFTTGAVHVVDGGWIM